MANQEDESLRKGPWLEQEDERLTTVIAALGERNWDALAKQTGLKRSGKSCRLRWMNYLRPNLKHGEISHEEEYTILHLQKQWGNKWARIARRLPGRTDNEIKNYWRSHLRKKTDAQQECFGETMNATKQDLMVPKCEDKYNTEDNCVNRKDGIFGISSLEAAEMCNMNTYGSSSPYESRMSDWITEGKHNEDCMGIYPCFCYLGSSCEENENCDGTSMVWDYESTGIWDRD